jgi:hypothetical protein
VINIVKKVLNVDSEEEQLNIKSKLTIKKDVHVHYSKSVMMLQSLEKFSMSLIQILEANIKKQHCFVKMLAYA